MVANIFQYLIRNVVEFEFISFLNTEINSEFGTKLTADNLYTLRSKEQNKKCYYGVFWCVTESLGFKKISKIKIFQWHGRNDEVMRMCPKSKMSIYLILNPLETYNEYITVKEHSNNERKIVYVTVFILFYFF